MLERQDGVAVQPNRPSATPCFEEDDAGELLGSRPRRRTTKTVEVDGVPVSLEQLAEGDPIVLGGSAPQLTVG